jgi:soluble lytic murein transglycosylase-like protein
LTVAKQRLHTAEVRLAHARARLLAATNAVHTTAAASTGAAGASTAGDSTSAVSAGTVLVAGFTSTGAPAAGSVLASTLMPAPTALPAASQTPMPTPTVTAAPTPAPAGSPTPLPSASPPVTPAPLSATQLRVLRGTVAAAQRLVRLDKQLVARLAAALRYDKQLAHWAATHNWRPLVQALAARWHVSASVLLGMMQRESSGRPTAVGGGGAYFGLFQYCPSTWHAAWNPWRHASIFDARAQISATALAVSRGYGPSWWPNTYRGY